VQRGLEHLGFDTAYEVWAVLDEFCAGRLTTPELRRGLRVLRLPQADQAVRAFAEGGRQLPSDGVGSGPGARANGEVVRPEHFVRVREMRSLVLHAYLS